MCLTVAVVWPPPSPPPRGIHGSFWSRLVAPDRIDAGVPTALRRPSNTIWVLEERAKVAADQILRISFKYSWQTHDRSQACCAETEANAFTTIYIDCILQNLQTSYPVVSFLVLVWCFQSLGSLGTEAGRPVPGHWCRFKWKYIFRGVDFSPSQSSQSELRGAWPEVICRAESSLAVLWNHQSWWDWSLEMRTCLYTSSTAQGGGGSFKNRKPIGEVGCCESGMAKRIHWWIERCLISLTLSLSFSAYLPTYLLYLPTYLSIFYLSIYRSLYLSLFSSNYLSSYLYLSIFLSIYLSLYLSLSLSIYLPTYLSIYLSIYLSLYLSIYLPTIYLSLSLSIYLSIYLSLYLSIYLSISRSIVVVVVVVVVGVVVVGCCCCCRRG